MQHSCPYGSRNVSSGRQDATRIMGCSHALRVCRWVNRDVDSERGVLDVLRRMLTWWRLS